MAVHGVPVDPALRFNAATEYRTCGASMYFQFK